MSSTADCPAPGSAACGGGSVCTLLLADVVDSTGLAARLDGPALTAWWQAHDQAARALLRRWHGREIDRSDGFLLLFETVADAFAFAAGYHRALAQLQPAALARVGVHHGAVHLRENGPADVALGAKPLEVDGLAKPLTARLTALAQGGQTLVSGAACAALRAHALPDTHPAPVLHQHGHWRLQGVDEPVELFEAGDAALPALPPPDGAKGYRVVWRDGLWAPVREQRHTLPAERDAFVGRRAELRDLAAHFERQARLVSVLGLGGVGKTRLARRYGWGWRGDYPGGVWFCDLSQATGIDGIVHAVAQGLELQLAGGDEVRQIGQAIAGRGRCLVIVDNFEQVAGHAEATLGAWLDRAAQASFLVTTREVLGICGEQALVLAPLAAGEGIDLFHVRAQAAGAALAPDPAVQSAVASLVGLLDGLPLAIELCAARVRVMPPAALLAHMGDRFRLLAAQGARTGRRATLRATLDWSWDLLADAERSALAQLSVFEGGFTLDAAQAVLALGDEPRAPWVVDAVQALVQKSLVRKVSDQRFDMLRTVQDYAAERLARAGAGEAARRRHWCHFAAIDLRAATAARCIESDNLVVACRRATAAGDSQAAAGALQQAWAALRRVGPYGVALDLAQQAQAACAAVALDLAAVHAVAGGVLVQLGRRTQARPVIEAAIEPAAALPPLQAQLLCTLADLCLGEGQRSAALAALERARVLARAHAAPLLECRALNGMGALQQQSGQLAEAEHSYRAALALARAEGDGDWEAALLGNLGGLLHSQGRLVDAQAHYEQAIGLAQQAADQRWEGNTRSNLGWLLHETGQPEAAQVQLEAALGIARHLGAVDLEAVTLCNLGIVMMADGRADAALPRLERSVELAALSARPQAEGQYRGYLGAAYARLGRAAEAVACFDVGQALLERLGDGVGLGVLLCQRAHAEADRGDHASAGRLWLQAEALAAQAGVGADSELGRLLAERRGSAARC